MAINRDSFPDALDKAIKTVYFEQYKEESPVYSQIFSVRTDDSDYVKDSEISGFGNAILKTEGANISLGEINQAYDVTFTHRTWGLGFIITEEMMEDNRIDLMKKLASSLPKAFPRTYETESAAIFNNGFTSGTYGDGVYFFSASHPRPDGGAVQSNLLTVAADLSDTSLKAAIVQMNKMRGLKGERLNLTPDILVVPPDIGPEAYTILNTQKITGSGNNDISYIVSKYNLKPIEWKYLSDTDAWFLGAKERQNVVFYWRKKPDLKQDLYISSRDVEYNSVMRFSVGIGPSGWRSFIGTPGV